MTKLIRKPLIWTHRYLGIALSLLFLMWFLTGIGMIYSRGMPRLTPEMRLARMAPLDLDAIRLSPAEAAGAAGVLALDPETTLLTVLGRPAYRFEGRSTTVVFADDGEVLESLTLDQAIGIASRFLDVPRGKITYDTMLEEPDQWTMTLTRNLPMFRLKVDDGAGTRVYVAPREAEVVQMTTRRGRALAWVSVIPHFLYFRSLRLDGELWNLLMVWGPGLGVVVALVGLILGVLSFKGSRPFRISEIPRYLPYRGWLRWHYATGLVFGILTLTFVASGLVSMEPWDWTQRDESLADATRRAFPGGTGKLDDYRRPGAEELSAVGFEVKEVGLTRVLGEPQYVIRGAPAIPAAMGWPDGGHQPYFVKRSRDAQREVLSARTFDAREPLDSGEIAERLEAAAAAPALESTLLREYDAYYYSREGRSPLPVVRVKLDDPEKTWLYVDPDTTQISGRISRVNRIERWLYAGLHTFDFPVLYARRPLWDAVLVVVCLGGALVSGLGVLMGARHVFRSLHGSAIS
jgi:PepSY-associated TM region